MNCNCPLQEVEGTEKVTATITSDCSNAVEDLQKPYLSKATEGSELSGKKLVYFESDSRVRNNSSLRRKVPLVTLKASHAIWRSSMLRVAIISVLFLILMTTWRSVTCENS